MMNDAYLLEYEKLKEEQGRRIHFRDNMRYVTIAAIGVVAMQAGKSMPELWLVIPWICVVLGWNYVANVHSVRGIGQYIESRLRATVAGTSGADNVFGWEDLRCEDDKYAFRRAGQLVVDEITFTIPGMIALAIFGITQGESALLWALVAVEALLCCWIGYQIYDAADARAKTWLRERPAWLEEQVDALVATVGSIGVLPVDAQRRLRLLRRLGLSG
jgi:hypothetical protein